MSYGPISQPSGAAILKQRKSAKTAILDEYRHVTNNDSHLRCTTSSAFPTSPGAFVSILADQKKRAADELKGAIAEKEALLTKEGRKEKELFDQANQAAYEWAEVHVPLQQANEKAYTIKRFGARRFKSMWKD